MVIQISHTYEYHRPTCESAAQVHIIETDGVLWLTNVYTHEEYRGKGLANDLLVYALQQWQHRDIYLKVQPYADSPIESRSLSEWYAKRGFVATDVPGVMKRPGS